LTEATDIVVSVPSSDRRRSELDGMMGLFLDLVVLRTDLADNPNFVELLRRVFEVNQVAYSHPGLSFRSLSQALQPELDSTQAQLDQVMFNFTDVSDISIDLPGLKVGNFPFPRENPVALDLILVLYEMKEGLHCSLSYNADLFSSVRMTNLLGQFGTLVRQIVEAPEKKICEYSIAIERLVPVE